MAKENTRCRSHKKIFLPSQVQTKVFLKAETINYLGCFLGKNCSHINCSISQPSSNKSLFLRPACCLCLLEKTIHLATSLRDFASKITQSQIFCKAKKVCTALQNWSITNGTTVTENKYICTYIEIAVYKVIIGLNLFYL